MSKLYQIVLASAMIVQVAFVAYASVVQTAALQQIAANTKPPVSIKLDMVGDDAGATLVNALNERPKQKKGNGK